MIPGGIQTVNLNFILWFASLPAEAAVVGLILYRRAWRSLPVFSVYCIFELIIVDIVGYITLHFFPSKYLTTYLVITALESALEFGVLVELTWSVLRPLRASLSRKSLIVIAVMIVVLGAIIWPFTGIQQLGSLSTEMSSLVRLLQTVSVLRVLFFLALAGCSQLLSIGWRDREIQIATGLGFSSIVSLGVEIMHSHSAMGPMYRHLNQLVVASFDCSVLYWVVCFAQKEAERREFTPQMQSILLAVAGSARVTRLAMKDALEERARNPRSF
jgi:hypothetical protein